MPLRKKPRKKTKKKVGTAKLNVEEFAGTVAREIGYLGSEKNRESDENWRKFFEEIQIDEMKKEVEELHEDFQRITTKKLSDCAKEVEKLNTRESFALETIPKIAESFEESMKEMKENFLKEREDILRDIEAILNFPDLRESLENDNTRLTEEITIQNETLNQNFEAKLNKIFQERDTLNQNLKIAAEENANRYKAEISNHLIAFENSQERAKKLVYIDKMEEKRVQLKNIINNRRKKDFLFVIFKEYFTKIKGDNEKKLNIFRTKRSGLRGKLNSIREILDKKTKEEKKCLETLAVISTEEIAKLRKIWAFGNKLNKILESIMKLNPHFSKIPPEKSLMDRICDLKADVIFLQSDKDNLLRENNELCQGLKNYCNNKIIDN